jgi:hypothetical protein
MSDGSRYVPESKDPSVNYDKFKIGSMKISPLLMKEIPVTTDSTGGNYYLGCITYTYETDQGKIEAPLRLRGPEMRAPNGKKQVKNKLGNPTGNYSMSFVVLKGVEEQVRFMEVLQEIYEACVVYMHEKKQQKKLKSEFPALGDSFMETIAYDRLRDVKRRWGGLTHPLYYGKDQVKADPESNPMYTVPIRKGAKGTLFLRPYLECGTCGDSVECNNSKHTRFTKTLDTNTIENAGFTGIPVVMIKDIFCGAAARKIRQDIETFIAVDTESKQAATTELNTIRDLEQKGSIDKDVYNERIRLISGTGISGVTKTIPDEEKEIDKDAFGERFKQLSISDHSRELPKADIEYTS